LVADVNAPLRGAIACAPDLSDLQIIPALPHRSTTCSNGLERPVIGRHRLWWANSGNVDPTAAGPSVLKAAICDARMATETRTGRTLMNDGGPIVKGVKRRIAGE
jgi:hypothetical protein